MTGIAAEIGGLADKTDPVSGAIRDRLTEQFSQRSTRKPASKPNCRPSRKQRPCPTAT